MIVIVHRSGKVVSVVDAANDRDIPFSGYATDALPEMAKMYPGRPIGWCEASYMNAFNTAYVPGDSRGIYSFFPGRGHWLPDAIGYVEDSVFLKMPAAGRFPTWLMSPVAGVAGADVWRSLPEAFPRGRNLGYFLNSFVKLGVTAGLSCFAEPALLSGAPPEAARASVRLLFRFVSQHYRKIWVFFLLYNMLVNERQLPLFSLLTALFYRRRSFPAMIFSKEGAPLAGSVDVLIPTIGREKYLYDVLRDLAGQTILPQRVVIIEQNPDAGSVSALSYLRDETWPFPIRHVFTHETGACQARNRGLAQVEADWVFMADDDIRIQPDFIEAAFAEMGRAGGEVFSFACQRPDQPLSVRRAHQIAIFGGGCSMVSRSALGDSRFDLAYEFGFGEDLDFGKQLMDKGFAIRYLPHPVIIHLKAPVGGFRTKRQLEWAGEALRPKPSPTVMHCRIVNYTREQLAGYRSVLMFKMLADSKRPWSFFKLFRKRWQRSLYWASRLPELRGSVTNDRAT